jgi:hypothetical protein
MVIRSGHAAALGQFRTMPSGGTGAQESKTSLIN